MLGIEGRHQPVEEAAPVGGRAGKEPVHGGREPEHAHVLAQGARNSSATCAVDQHQPALRGTVAFALAAPAGAERHGPCRGFDLRCNRPGAGAALPGKVLEGGTAQAAARRQQRDGFQQIGLARAIGARQGNEPAPSTSSRRPA